MCAVVNRSGDTITLDASLAAMDAYGLDGGGQWTEGNVGLGARLTSVTDEAHHAVFPWHDEATGLVITADAWLDNRDDLCAVLGIESVRGQVVPDALLIARAYQKWGGACPRHLLGDFAFVIWDKRTRTLICARDHVGARPLYYSLTPQQCVVASSINGVLAVAGVEDSFDEAYIAASLLDGHFVHEAATSFQAVRKLPPAHTLIVRHNTERIERYWFPEHLPDITLASDADYAEAFLDVYTRAVKACLRTSEPVGVHCTGGLDSSSIAVLAAREARERGDAPPAAFSWQPAPRTDPPTLEHRRIASVCEQEGLALRYQDLTVADVYTMLSHDPAREPVTSTLVHEGIVQRDAAALGVRVILSGWGGDEVATFNGRGYYTGLLAHGQWVRLYQESRSRSSNPWKFIAKQAVLPLLPYGDVLKQRRWAELRSYRHRSYIHSDLVRRVTPLESSPIPVVGVRRTQLGLLRHGHISERIESWVAHGAKHHLTYRFPLLDRRVLEFALGLPPDQFRRGAWSRWVIRNAVESLLPAEVCWNRDKSDAERVGQLRPVVQEALSRVGHELAQRPTPPLRSMYLDYPRLVRNLTVPNGVSSALPRNMRAAVQFLDF